MRSIFSVVATALALGLALAPSAGRAESKSKGTGWLRVTTPEFVVITALKEKDALAWTSEFAQYVAALRVMFPKNTGASPLTIVLFSRESDFAKYRPLGADGRAMEVSGFFLRNLSWSVAGLGGSDFSQEVRRTIFHEGVHWFLSGTDRANPVWLEEGLAEVFSTFQVDKTSAKWGEVIPEHVALLRRHGLMPMERLLFTGREELFGKDTSHTGNVYAQSWAFAHYLLFGKHEIPTTAIGEYARLVGSDLGPDEAFRRAFGLEYKAVDQRLKEYIGGGTYFVRRRELAKFQAPTLEPASQIEVENALGRFAWSGNRWATAAAHARAAIALAPTDARGHDLLGLALKSSGDANGATAEFARAVDLGSTDAMSYFELALAEHKESEGGFGQGARMDGPTARRVVSRYEQAINLYPRMLPTYQNIAALIDLTDSVSADDRRFLEYGHQLWPQDGMILTGLAITDRRAGNLSAANEQLARVLATKTSDDAPAREFARRLQDSWEERDIITALEKLLDANKFAEAMAFIESQLEKGVSAAMRRQLLRVQEMTKHNLAMKQIEESLNTQQWSVSRKLITEFLNSDSAPGAMKSQVRRVLADLDRQRLGLEAEKK